MKKIIAVAIVILWSATSLFASGPRPPWVLVDPVYYYTYDEGSSFGAEINFWPAVYDNVVVGCDAAWIFAGDENELYCDVQAAKGLSDLLIAGTSTGPVYDLDQGVAGWQVRVFLNYAVFGISTRCAIFSDGSWDMSFGAYLSIPVYASFSGRPKPLPDEAENNP